MLLSSSSDDVASEDPKDAFDETNDVPNDAELESFSTLDLCFPLLILVRLVHTLSFIFKVRENGSEDDVSSHRFFNC